MMPTPVSIILPCPQRHQQYVRTSNLVERAFVEERRRTKVIPHLWTEGSLVHLVFGVLIRVSDRWGKKCFSDFEQQQIRSFANELKLDEQEVSMSEPSSLCTNSSKCRVCCLTQVTGTEALDRRSARPRPLPGLSYTRPRRAHGLLDSHRPFRAGLVGPTD